MKNVFVPCSLMIFMLVLSPCKSQETADAIVNMASDACVSLKSVKYFVKKTPLKKGMKKPTFKGVITLAKDPEIDHAIFKGYMYHSNINFWIHSDKKRKINTAFDGEDFYVETEKELTKYENPTSQTVMRKLGFELYLLIYNGLINEKGLDVVLKRELSLLKDTTISGIPSHHIKATASIPVSPGSTEKRESETDWFFSKSDYLPTGYSDGKYFTSIQILEKDFTIDKSDFSLTSQGQLSFSEKTNSEVLNENLLEIGSVSPAWSAKTLNKKELSSSNLKGKAVLIDFWGTWCPPCIKSMPSIQRINEKYNEVEVIGIAVKDDFTKVQKFIKKKGFTYTIIPDGNEIAKSFGVAEYPTLYILNKKGEVAYREKGYNEDGFDEWSGVIEDLLNE